LACYTNIIGLLYKYNWLATQNIGCIIGLLYKYNWCGGLEMAPHGAHE